MCPEKQPSIEHKTTLSKITEMMDQLSQPNMGPNGVNQTMKQVQASEREFKRLLRTLEDQFDAIKMVNIE